jgi:hypothetical protein
MARRYECFSFAANLIAAAERHAANLERLERLRAYREREATSTGAMVRLRRSLGFKLIHLGEFLGGTPAPAHSPANSAG